MILYNKYRSILRVFFSIAEPHNFNGVEIYIQFDDYTSMRTNLLDQHRQIKALDDGFVSGHRLVSIPDFSSATNTWFYTDFPVMYDPCTCLFQSKLNILIEGTNISSITGSSGSSGTLESLAEDGRSTSEGSSNVIGEAVGVTKKAINAFKALNSLHKKPSGSPDTNRVSKFGQFVDVMKTTGLGKAVLTALPFISDVVSILDFFLGGGKKASNPTQVELMPSSIKMSTDYTLQTNTDYGDITFRTSDSNIPSTVPNSQYPYYNEVLGIFNLLQKPKLVVYQVDNHAEYEEYWGPDGLEFEPIYERESYLKFEQPIQYVFNPASGMEIQEIQTTITGNLPYELNGQLTSSELHFESLDATTNLLYRPLIATSLVWISGHG